MLLGDDRNGQHERAEDSDQISGPSPARHPRRRTLAAAVLIWRGVLSRGQGEAPPGWVAGRRLSGLVGGPVGERVFRRAVRLICAGWLPQDGVTVRSRPRV